MAAKWGIILDQKVKLLQLRLIQANPHPAEDRPLDQKGTHVIGDFLHLILLHKEHFRDLLTWALEYSGNQRVIGVLQLLFLWNHTARSRPEFGLKPLSP